MQAKIGRGAQQQTTSGAPQAEAAPRDTPNTGRAPLEPAVRLRGLTRDFGPTRAVDGLTLDIPKGIVFGFLGPNGAGKTTTINLLLGLLEPTAGRAEVLGFDTRTQGGEVRARVGALLEHNGLYEHLSAEDNLGFYARAWRMPPGEREDRIEELLSGMGFWDRRAEKVGTWSRGMQQRLAVARTLLHRPDLVFLDEPTAGLDVMAATELRASLANLAESEGVTVFLTTHNMTEAERLCGLVAVIRAGRVMAVGSPDTLRAQAGGERVEITGSGFDDAVLAALRDRAEVLGVERGDRRLSLQIRTGSSTSPVVRMLVDAGADVEEVRRGQASLEEVFLTLMEEEA